jgi:hypothetical protein
MFSSLGGLGPDMLFTYITNKQYMQNLSIKYEQNHQNLDIFIERDFFFGITIKELCHMFVPKYFSIKYAWTFKIPKLWFVDIKELMKLFCKIFSHL